MTQTLIFDRQWCTDKLRDNGIDKKAARAHGDALDGALREAIATKADVQSVKADVQSVRDELAAVKLELKHDIAALETKLEAKIDTSIGNLHRDLTAASATKQTELIKWMIGSQVGLLVTIMTLLELFKF